MTQPHLPQREKQLLRELAALVGERARAEAAADSDFHSGQEAARLHHERTLAQIEERAQAHAAAAEEEYAAAKESLANVSKSEQAALELRFHDDNDRVSGEIAAEESQAQKSLSEARWLARTVYEAARKRLHQKAQKAQKQIRAPLERAGAIERQADACLTYFGHKRLVVPPPVDPEAAAGDDESPLEPLIRAVEIAETHLRRLEALRLPKFVRSGDFLSIFVALAAVIGPLTGWLANWRPLYWLPPAAFLILSIGIAISLWLRALVRRYIAGEFVPLVEQVRIAQACGRRCLNTAAKKFKQQRAEMRRQREADARRAMEAYKPRMAHCRLRRELELPQLAASAEQQAVALRERFKQQNDLLAARYAQQETDARAAHQRDLADAQTALQTALAANQARFDAARATYLSAWQHGLAAARAETGEIAGHVESVCPPWEALATHDWHPSQSPPDVTRFGALSIALKSLLPNKESGQLAADAAALSFSLPAVLRFPDEISTFIRAQDAGRRRAIDLLQVIMLRLLLTVPPGKLRFTIIDPVGLGQNFAAFMHLADFDEALVNHRIWTEPTQIEQRLADLTEHMETVIQKYLRDEYPTIAAYNAEAGEIAEPYRVLVVANFPAGFSDAAARRLLTIAANGPRCGVHLLLSVDAKLPPLPDFSLADLQRRATIFSANSTQLQWHDRELKQLPLVVDLPPAPEQVKTLLQAAGRAAVSASRVEVPFDVIAPAAESYWTADSRRGIDVPLGRVGATRLQHLRLGQGTSQHVLIAGKTGSGKSTLLHALITNAALRYSPDELELYLIDFKKGVEFKTYVAHNLPHARVVAIESEREFGLSVMQRLDREMQVRGERFRELGVQDIAGYRDLGHSLPRILFIIDEFQEFFVEDDKLAQEASLLLDRLIRQGRAFGIHVHLGSQTLAGAYTLARSTLGQVGVRIALQCSDADAHLILNEDNQAARLLSRPGEAIYNDANGLIEGNHPFQVVWLPDQRREVYLDAIQKLAADRLPGRTAEQIVFEGTRPADIEKSTSLAAALSADAAAPETHEPRIWIGEPLAIQETTSVAFPCRGGANLLWLGQNEDAVAGMMGAALLSLAPRLSPVAATGRDQVQFNILSGTSGGPFAGSLGRLAALLPRQARVYTSRELPALLNSLGLELARRQGGDASAAPLFLLVYDLPRLRELRHQEESFSFSRGGEPQAPRPDRQFAELLRDGPPLGIHLLVWCDTLTNFNRILERHSLREFETRVLLQMSAADSSLLIDSPAASQLGRHRALFYREDEGRLEKFRPFAAPSESWLDLVTERLRARQPEVAQLNRAVSPDPKACPA